MRFITIQSLQFVESNIKVHLREVCFCKIFLPKHNIKIVDIIKYKNEIKIKIGSTSDFYS